MRSWRKWGVLLAGLACGAAIAQASDLKLIEDNDAFEKKYIECIMNAVKGNCVASLFKEHLSPEMASADTEATINQINDMLKEAAIKNNGVYGIYEIEKTVEATIYDNRVYLMELGNGRLIGFRIVFRQLHGKWYIELVKVTRDRDAISRFLGLVSRNGDNL